MVARAFCLAAVLAASLLGAAPARSQAPAADGLTFEWVYGDEGRRVASVLAHAWLSDGRLLLFDVRRPPAERKLTPLGSPRRATRSGRSDSN